MISPSLRVKHIVSRRKRTFKRKGKDEEVFEKGKKIFDLPINEEVKYDQLSDIGEDGNERGKYPKFNKKSNMENPNLFVGMKFQKC